MFSALSVFGRLIVRMPIAPRRSIRMALSSLMMGCLRVRFYCYAMLFLMAAQMRSTLTAYCASRDRANGTGMKGAPTRRIGASSSSKATSAMRAAISAPTPNDSTASCAMTNRWVRATEAAIRASGVDHVLSNAHLEVFNARTLGKAANHK